MQAHFSFLFHDNNISFIATKLELHMIYYNVITLPSNCLAIG